MHHKMLLSFLWWCIVVFSNALPTNVKMNYTRNLKHIEAERCFANFKICQFKLDSFEVLADLDYLRLEIIQWTRIVSQISFVIRKKGEMSWSNLSTILFLRFSSRISIFELDIGMFLLVVKERTNDQWPSNSNGINLNSLYLKVEWKEVEVISFCVCRIWESSTA